MKVTINFAKDIIQDIFNNNLSPPESRLIGINMKTQINQLVKGDHRTSIVGTKSEIRNEVARQVVSENPESMTISIHGIEIQLKANWSLSRKSVTYFGDIPVSLYYEFFGDFGMPKENQKAFVQVNTDMSVWFTTNSKKSMHQIVKEQEVTIL